MRILKGGFSFPVNGANWRESERRIRINGIDFARQIIVNVSGRLLGTDSRDLNRQVLAMQTAMRQSGGDVILQDNDGTRLEALLSANASTPPACIIGPTFSGDSGSEYVIERNFSCTFMATYPEKSGQLIIIESSRSITVFGGYPDIVWLTARNNARPQRQIVTPQTTFKALQQGSIVSMGGLAPIDVPRFNRKWLMDNPAINESERKTEFGTEYTVNWLYRFESDTALA